MKLRLFVDMDGTIAKFYHHKQCLEKMYEQNYFLDLQPYAITKTIKELAGKSTIEVFVLSACIKSPYCKQEKIAWLDKHLPEIDSEHRILVDVGENKADYIPHTDEPCVNILLDDYSKNLEQWEQDDENNIAFKFINGLNNKTNKPYKTKITSGKQLLEKLTSLVLFGRVQELISYALSPFSSLGRFPAYLVVGALKNFPKKLFKNAVKTFDTFPHL